MRTHRLNMASRRLEDAQQKEQEARRSGDKEQWKVALAELSAAELEWDAARQDAVSRGRVGEGGRRRDRALTVEQENARQLLFERLSLPVEHTLTPSVKEHRVNGVEFEPWAMEAIELWREHCNTLGNATIVRWLAMAGLILLGPPPGWQKQWPPDTVDK